MEIELAFLQLIRLETAVLALSSKQKREKGVVSDEILKQDLVYFLNDFPNILGPIEDHRKNIHDILAWIDGRINFKKKSWDQKIIRDVLEKLK